MEQLSLGHRRIRVDKDWTIIVEDEGLASYVYLQHRSGARVPPGRSPISTWKVDAEVERLRQSVVGPLYASNPTNTSWLWVGAAVALGAVAWLVTRSTKPKAWTCRAGMECTHHEATNSWDAKNLITNGLELHDGPPENLNELTLDETGPGGAWKKYVLSKPAVMQGADVYGSLWG